MPASGCFGRDERSGGGSENESGRGNVKHPTERVLSEFAAWELPPRETERLEAHLAGCGRCQREVEAYRTLRQRALDLSDPTPPPGFIDEVIRRRASGERVLLATGDIRAVNRGSRWTPMRVAGVAALALLAVTVSYSVLAPPVTASKGELRILPAMPAPGSEVEFEYRPISYLAGQDSLRLRIRARQAGDPPPRGGLIGDLRVATLHRRPDGAYAGHISVGPDDVFLAAAVEDFEGRDVDTNFGKLWEIFVVDESGEPSTAALEARYRILEYYDWILATEWIASAVEQYPHRAIVWAQMFASERVSHDSITQERLRYHTVRLDSLMAALEAPGATVEDLTWAAIYARDLNQPDARRVLLERLKARQPTNQEVQLDAILHIWAEQTSPAARLARFDSLWAANDDASPALVTVALGVAAEASDSAALRRWLDRNRRVHGVSRAHVISLLAGKAEFAPLRLSLMRERLDSLRSTGEVERPLPLSIDDYAASRGREIATQEWELAGGLTESGDTREAMDLYESSVAQAWDPRELAPYATLLLDRGDTARARPLIARMAADPLEGERATAPFESAFPRDSSEFRRLLDLGRVQYRRALISSLPVPQPVSGDPAVSFVDGPQSRLRDLLMNGPTVLVIWNPARPGSEDLIRRVRAAAATTGVRTVFVSTRSATPVFVDPEPTPIIEGFPVVEERNREIAEAVRQFSSTENVVVDADLRVLASPADPETAYRIAVVSTWP